MILQPLPTISYQEMRTAASTAFPPPLSLPTISYQGIANRASTATYPPPHPLPTTP